MERITHDFLRFYVQFARGLTMAGEADCLQAPSDDVHLPARIQAAAYSVFAFENSGSVFCVLTAVPIKNHLSHHTGIMILNK